MLFVPVVRTPLLNHRLLPVVGAVPFAQFAVVLQLEFVPPPVHVKTAADAVVEASKPDPTKATVNMWRQRVVIRANVFINTYFLRNA